MNEGQKTPGLKSTGALKRWGMLTVVCLVVLAVLAGLKYLQVSRAIAFGKSFPERSEAVTAIVATPVSWQQRYRTIGEVLATRYLELRNEVGGRIIEVGFVGGSRVEEGQQLLLLDSTEEQAQRKATQAQLRLAELQLQRLAELRRKNLASKEDYDSAEAEKAVLQAKVAELTATIAKKALIAPFDAQTGLHTLQVGQYLAPNSIITYLTGGNGEVWIDFDLPQGKASLAIGDTVIITSRSLSTDALAATIISADARLKPRSRSREFRALLIAPPEAIRPGSVVGVEVGLGSLSGVFSLPAGAVRRNSFGAYVYVLNEAEPGAIAAYRASRRQVTLGATQDENVIVTGGLEAGELVAAIGAFKLADGLLTHVVQRKAYADSGSLPPGPGQRPQESGP